MSRDYGIYIQDIFEAIQRVERYSENKSLDSFCQDYMAIDAVVRNLEIMGEAAKHIPQSMRTKYPEIP